MDKAIQAMAIAIVRPDIAEINRKGDIIAAEQIDAKRLATATEHAA